MSSTSAAEVVAEGGGRKYKGVRRRKWGKWVSEIRLPNSRERVWLGSYDAPEQAARAFDAAFVCLRGAHAAGADLNFPDFPPPVPPRHFAAPAVVDPQEVQAAALSHANRASAAALFMDSSPAATETPPPAAAAMDEDDVPGGCQGVGPPEDGSMDWRPAMPPLFSPTGCWPGGGSNAYDFLLQVPPPLFGDEDVMDQEEEESGHGADASLWSFDPRSDSYFRY